MVALGSAGEASDGYKAALRRSLPHTKAFGHGLFELRLKGAEGIARVFYCTVVGRRIYMLHCFVKKSQKTPQADLSIAIARMKEVKRENS